MVYKSENINVYIMPNTEEALELIKRKRFNKIILISSIGLDLSGKTFGRKLNFLQIANVAKKLQNYN